MLEIYAKEFTAIGKYLQKKERVHKGYILVEKKKLEGLLNKNHYDTAANKLRIWKVLKWIDTDADGRLTKRIYDGQTGTYKPFVKMSVEIVEQLQMLQNAN